MKLAEHVKHIKDQIHKAFSNQFSRLGIGAENPSDLNLIPEDQHSKWEKMLDLINTHKDEGGSYTEARARALEELTFTLFNRIAALKVMEARQLFPEIITKRPENGDRSFQHKAWLEQHPEMRSEELEGLREFLKHSFNQLGEEINLYHKSYPYALLPHTLELNAIIEAFNIVEKDKDIDVHIWASDDILGWLYESYNNDKKAELKASEAKTEYDKVSLQSQVYTPRWVVEFLVNNSLGKLYLEMFPTSDIKNRYKIAKAPQKQLRQPKPLTEVRLIDPACGSGNFLLYAFDFFYELYLDQIENFGADYEEDEIPALILQHNLHGIDLDDRSIQLAQLGLFIKAKTKNRHLSATGFKVVSSDFFLPDYVTVRPLFEEAGTLEEEVKELLQEIWSDLQNAHRFGSLLRIEEKLNDRIVKLQEEEDLFSGVKLKMYSDFKREFFPRIKAAVSQYTGDRATAFLKGKTLDALTYLEVISQKYAVAVANPPYTDSGSFGPELKDFVNKNYKQPYKFNTNLYASFIKRCAELTDDEGYVGMIHPHTFMFIKSYEDVRKYLIDKTHIQTLVDFGLDRVNLFGPGILLDATFYTFCNRKSDEAGLYFKITSGQQEKFKKSSFEEALEAAIDEREHKRLYHLPQSKLKLIKGWPFIYWISDAFREKFKAEDIKHHFYPAQGAATTNNNRFLRFWWEVDEKNISENHKIDKGKWVPYGKGGPFQKWFGNLWLVLNWGVNGEELLNAGAVLRNKEHYFNEGVTYSASGSKGASYRVLPKNCAIDTGGSAIFIGKKFNDSKYLAGFLNSKLSSYIIDCLNPTVNTQVGDIQRVPFVLPKTQIQSTITLLVEGNVRLNQKILSYKPYEKDYLPSSSPLTFEWGQSLNENILSFLNYENQLFTIQLLNEAIINDLIFQVYELSEHDIQQVLESEGLSVGEYLVHPEALEAFKKAIKDSEFTTEELWQKLDEIEQDDQVEQKRSEVEAEFPYLYKSNYGFEEFCIQNEVNPINAWYWFRESGIVPVHRAHDIALEFLADMIREVLMEDEDGIIPLVRNAGEDILLDRLEQKMQEKGFSTAQISQLDGLLGRSLNDYINGHFFKELSDHLNLFMYLPKTPFIWHLSSGPERGFECYIVIYKWSRDKLQSIKSVYVEKRERALINRKTDLGDRKDAAAQNERDTIDKQLEEIKTFRQKIDDLLASGYDPKLDDGVGKNIAPLQERKMIPYEVLNKGQLKKYLNADW